MARKIKTAYLVKTLRIHGLMVDRLGESGREVALLELDEAAGLVNVRTNEGRLFAIPVGGFEALEFVGGSTAK